MKLKETFVLKQIGNETVAVYVNKDTADLRHAVSLKGSSKIIFEALMSEVSKDELEAILISNYGITKQQAKEDVASFLQLLKNYNLLEG
ncbi:MAG: PqqD family protein [Clostridia bacterium]|nr:PqqD family protein [Clostridia bacterium]